MPSASGAERPDSYEVVTDLLSEARYLISRERMTDDNNLLQIQQIIEAAQRELRRWRHRSEVDRLFIVGEAVDVGVDGIESDDSGGLESRDNLENAGGASSDDGSGGVFSVLARTGQIFITGLEQSQESNAETRQEAIQTNEPLRGLDLYLGERTDWTLAGPQEPLQQTNGHEAAVSPAESSSQVQQMRSEIHEINEHAQSSDNAAIAGLGLGVGGPRPSDQQGGDARMTRQEFANIDIESPLTEDASFDPTGQSLRDTDLSRLHRERSFVSFIDRRLGRATSSSLSNPGNILDQMPGGGDSWVIRPRPGTQEEILATANDEESSLESDESLSGITPLPSAPRSLPVTLRQEIASLNSSTGAMVGTEVIVEENQEQPPKDKQSPFAKERRAQLMAEMDADIARYSQQREWAFYWEHGYCVPPRTRPPEPLHELASDDRNPIEAAGMPEDLLNRQELLGEVLLVDAVGRRLEVDLEEVRNRTESPSPLSLPDHEEEFLVYLLSKISREDSTQWMAQPEQFVERMVQPSLASRRYQLVGSVAVSRDQDRATYRRLTNLLRLDRIEAIRIARAIRHGEDVDGIDVGQDTALETIMESAIRDGMNVRQAVAFLTEWFLWLDHTAEIWPAPAELVDIQVLQFWVALRRGWGRWQPSQGMLNAARRVLQEQSRIFHPLNNNEPGLDDSDDENLLRTIRASDLPPEEQDRLCSLQEDYHLHHGRIAAIYANWISYLRHYLRTSVVARPSQFRLASLDRLIREERVINARRSPSN